MNILRAESYLSNMRPSNMKLADIYDDDEMLQSALTTLFPDFEYPDFSHLTMEQICKRYFANPRTVA